MRPAQQARNAAVDHTTPTGARQALLGPHNPPMTPEIDTGVVAVACIAGFAAGFIDAVVGGGGLITTPTLIFALPGVPLPAILATTKAASCAGTVAAAWQYLRRVAVDPRVVVPAAAAALMAAWCGARLVTALDTRIAKPLILAVLVGVAGYTWANPALGSRTGPAMAGRWRPWAGLALGAGLGFYDGFLGPGTGTFLILALVLGFGRDFLTASAAAKVINAASNLGALLWFVPEGSVLWSLALPMAMCNLLGGVIGSRAAMARGNPWIRRIYLLVASALILRLGYGIVRA
jgi:uncharacterized membrane protein YfcA